MESGISVALLLEFKLERLDGVEGMISVLVWIGLVDGSSSSSTSSVRVTGMAGEVFGRLKVAMPSEKLVVRSTEEGSPVRSG